jgi:hypothetical protein
MPFLRKDLLVLAAYALVALVFSYPLVTMLSTASVGEGADGWQDTWEMWWLSRALATGTPPYHFATLYAPDGATNYLHSLNPILIVLTFPVQWTFGPIASYNVACLLALVFTAFAAYLLARDVTGSRAAGFIGGLICGFAPRQFSHLLGHLDVLSIQFMVFGVWCHYRGLRAKGRGVLVWLLWAAACVAASALTHPYPFIALLLILVVTGAYRAASLARAGGWRVPVARTLLAIVVGLIVVSPLLYAMLRQLAGPDAPRRRDIPQEIWVERERFSADLAAYILPSPFHPLWGKATRPATEKLANTISESVVFPGIAAIFLGITGIIASATRRKARPWWIVGLTGFLLSLGPSIRVSGATVDVLMPADLFYLLPGTDMVRVPARFSMILMLGLAVCAALGVLVLKERLASSRWKMGVLVLPTLLSLFEYLPAPYPVAPYELDPWYRQVEASNSRDVLLEVPFDPNDPGPLMRQMAHGIPLAGGYLSRQPAEPLSGGVPPFAELGLNRAIGLEQYDRMRENICQPQFSATTYLGVLRLAGVRYVTLHPERLPLDDPRPRLLESLMPGAPMFRSDRLTVYETGGGDAPTELLGITEDWEDWYPKEGIFKWALTRQSRLYVWSGAERDVTLSLSLRSFEVERTVTLALGENTTFQTQVSTIEHPVSLKWRIPRGFTTIAITASGPAITPASLGMNQDGRPLTIGIADCSLTAND